MIHRIHALLLSVALCLGSGAWSTAAVAQPAPFSGVTIDTLLDTPIRVIDPLIDATGADLLPLGTGMSLGDYEGQPVAMTEDGFSLQVTVSAPAGPITVLVEVSAPTKGTDSFFLEVDGVQLDDPLVLPYQTMEEVSVSVTLDTAGDHTFRLFLRENPGSALRRFAVGTFVVQSPLPPMRPELTTGHPRMFLTPNDVARLRTRLADPRVQAFYRVPSVLNRQAPTYQPGSRNGGAFRNLGQYALGHLLEPNPEQVTAVNEWLLAATTFGDVGVDLDAEYFLEGLALTYDWMYNDIPEPLRTDVRDTIAEKCRTVVQASLDGKSGGGLAFQQNHYWYSNFAVALGAAALYGEVPEAEQWLAWAWDRLERILLTFSPDGAFHEGPAYWDFSIPVLYMYSQLYEELSGVPLPAGEDGMRGQGQFRFHHLFPGFERTVPLEDTTMDRAKPPIRLLLWEAKRFQDPVTMGLAALLNENASSNHFHLLWLDEALTAQDALATIPLGTSYSDVETAFGRSSWESDATHFAFVSRPLGGHTWADLCERYGLGGTGHNHPEQNHFTLFGRGELLVGDPGYTYEKKTRNHNTVLVDGEGQLGDGEMWPSPTEGRSHLTLFTNEGDVTIVGGDATSAYPEHLGLTGFERFVVLAGRDLVVVHDRLAASEPRTFSWLLHHWANVDDLGGSFTLTRGDAQLGIVPVHPQDSVSRTETYRPIFVHPDVDHTPEEPDIQLVELTSGPIPDTTFMVALLVGDAGSQVPQVTDASATDFDAVRVLDTLVVFNRTDGVILVPLPWGETLSTEAPVVVARIRNGEHEIIAPVAGTIGGGGFAGAAGGATPGLKSEDDGCGCRIIGAKRQWDGAALLGLLAHVLD